MTAQLKVIDGEGLESKPRFDRKREREPYLSKRQAAEFYAVKPATIDYWCRKGMPFHQKGGRRKFRVSEMEGWHGRGVRPFRERVREAWRILRGRP